MVFAAAGTKKRELIKEIPASFSLPEGFQSASLTLPGVLTVNAPAFENESQGEETAKILATYLEGVACQGIALVVLTEDAGFAAKTLKNFLWVTFTRSNPSHDIYGVGASIRHKHWGCKGPLIIDARLKPHHAPPLIENPEVTKRAEGILRRAGFRF